jgi:hypothetical protein
MEDSAPARQAPFTYDRTVVGAVTGMLVLFAVLTVFFVSLFAYIGRWST